ncbi:circularly permuted type 2 ATP-grasp protein [Ferrovibrio sp.]|uniref:circularly permuted type 2 ATP-grasp protein n=1 Tax=Ferrovibrio sp. TaxID=1917215 RepID=UPI0025BD77C3|nr:circularly permuted type 2 ATP-grasp protein [Ferrovibrio sp.]MBX3453513.1 circularly permuted type 2 ATP-grasp protein [Ferrovibrio sp.]
MPAFDEMTDAAGAIRAPYRGYAQWLQTAQSDRLQQRRHEADTLFRRLGITFAVYGEGGDTERLIPFDIVPRILSASEWARLRRGLEQRVKALNAFLDDIYHDKAILREGKIPADLITGNEQYTAAMAGFKVPHGIYSHIAGIDLVRTGEDEFFVLEDNARTPSGVSYMLENREAMMRLFPELFGAVRVAPVGHYPDALLQTLRECAPPNCNDEPTVALLTPGVFNSAYFEHVFLAEQMGIELVEGSDLVVRDNRVYMRMVGGLKRVDVLYRRLDDAFLDPQAFRKDSMIGVPGLFAAYKAGNITITNAVGTGVADDKSIYPYVPEMVRFYLAEEPLLANVPTYILRRPDDLKYTLEHLPELVVKEVHGSGGYGMLVGPRSSKAEIEAFRAKIIAKPEAYIAQPTLALSTCPTFVDQGLAPRHVDLRPFVLSGNTTRIVPGGLTRVALREGSLVVNSSQGGGTKDTWILEPGPLDAPPADMQAADTPTGQAQSQTSSGAV